MRRRVEIPRTGIPAAVAQAAGRVAGGARVSYRTAVLVEPGRSARTSLVVTEADTALAMRSGDVAVLATPRLIALCEEAACKAVDGALGKGRTSVGVRIQFDHLAPVRIGSEITAEATLERVEGRRLVFTVTATDPAGLVGAGKMTRAVVELESFLAKAR
jgi:predicted thioesterase